MRVECPKCGQPVAGGDIQLSNGTAVCRACAELFPLPTVNATRTTAMAERPTDAMDTLDRPGDLAAEEMRDLDGAWHLVIRPSARHLAIPRLAFAAFWCAFLVLWYSIALRTGGADGIMFWFPILHVAVGLWLLYDGLGRLFNRTNITFAGDWLRVHTRPLPKRKSVQTLRDEIDGFEVVEGSRMNNRSASTQIEFRVHMLFKRYGISRPLGYTSLDPMHAHYVKDRLNAELLKLQAPTNAYR